MFKEKVTFSLPCLKSLVASEISGVHCKPGFKRTLMISPIHLHDLKRSVKEILASRVTTYDIELCGIILSHKNVKISSSVEMNDEGKLTLEYIADIYIFTPKIGSILTGRVNKKARDVIGCLVHSVFNVAIPRPRFDEDSAKKWIGSKAYIGQNVTFSIAKLDFTGRLPYIRGQLISLENDASIEDEGADSGMGYQESNDDEVSIKEVVTVNPTIEIRSPPILKRKRSSSSLTPIPINLKKQKMNSSDEGLSGEDSINTSSTSSSKKGKVNNGELLLDGAVKIKTEPPEDAFVPPKVKTKKHRSSTVAEMESLSSSLLNEALESRNIKTENVSDESTQLDLDSSFRSKKKKSKHSKSYTTENLEDLSQSLLSDAVAGIKKELSDHSDGSISSRKSKKSSKDEQEMNDTDKVEVSIKKSKKKKKDKGNEEETLDSSCLVESPGVDIKKKTKRTKPENVDAISSALLQDAIEHLNVKRENIKQEVMDPSTTDLASKTKKKKKKKAEMEVDLETVREKLLAETVSNTFVDSDKKRGKHRASELSEDIFKTKKKDK